MSESFEVIIIGAGPVGALLSCELALAGVSVLVLEKETATDPVWRDGPLGYRGVNIPSGEAFYRRGLYGEIFGDEKPNYLEKTPGFQFAGHFAGIIVNGANVDFSQWKHCLPAPLRAGPATLGKIERILCKRAESLGVRIIRGVQVTSFADEGETVKVLVGDKTFEAQYLVGCDGGKSFVRRSAGFDFVGTEPEWIGYVTNAKTDRPLKPMFHSTGNGMTMSTPWGTVIALDFNMDFDRTQPVTREHFQTVLRRVTGTDINVTECDVAGSFTDRAKQVTCYRKGRILVAGDAAHIHSPQGGQGMNLGLADAMNLGWKLAATIKGHANEGLLDTYHNERHSVGAKLLDWTRAQTSLLRPDPCSRAMYQVTKDLIDTPDGASRFAGAFFGLSQRYDLGGEHWLVGRSTPDFEIKDGQRLGPVLKHGGFVLVDFEKSSAAAELVASLNLPVRYIEAETKETLGAKAVLVRPDGIVSWATDEPIEVDALKGALSKWLKLPGQA